jgi:hypothetical protein
MKHFLIAAGVAGILLNTPVAAQEVNVSGLHVTSLFPGSFPSQLWFSVDPPIPVAPLPPPIPPIPCGALFLAPSGSDAPSKQAFMEAAYSLLLAAKLTGSTVTVIGNNGCVATAVSLQ